MNFTHILIALDSKISPGAFSGERLFSVRLANDENYVGLAPREFCWNEDDVLVGKNEPEKSINGKVAARVVREVDPEQFVVEVPDGTCIAVDKKIINARPTSIEINSIKQGNYIFV